MNVPPRGLPDDLPADKVRDQLPLKEGDVLLVQAVKNDHFVDAVGVEDAGVEVVGVAVVAEVQPHHVEALLEHARGVFAAIDGMEAEAALLGSSLQGKATLAANSTTAMMILTASEM